MGPYKSNPSDFKVLYTFLIIFTLSPSPDSKVENERRAIFENPSNLLAISEALTVISLSISSFTFMFTAQSEKIYSKPSGEIIRKKLEILFTLDEIPTVKVAASITLFVGFIAPATIASA